MGVAYIIEGDLEKLFIEEVCGGVPVRKVGNGRDVQIGALVKRIASLLRLFRGRFFPVVIVLDREGRTNTSVDMEAEILRLLRDLGHDEELIIAVPDRMLENWICAGSIAYRGEGLTQLHGDSQFDERGGKSVLKEALRDIGIPYDETTVGVEMLKSIDVELCCRRSESFRRLKGRVEIFCPWLKRKVAAC